METKLYRYVVFAVVLTGLVLTGCKRGMVISQVNYAQPLETVLEPNKKGIVHDVKQGIKFSILPLQYTETGDTSSVTTDRIRMIRSQEGYYYITASGYRNVYIFEPEENKLKLKKQIQVSEGGIASPAFNQRDTYIQLVSRDTGESYALSAEGIFSKEVNESRREARVQ